MAIILVVGLAASIAGIIYTKHNGRILFVELQELHEERDALNTEWGMLQLEQSTWATHGRIEKIARRQLGMSIPDSKKILVLENE